MTTWHIHIAGQVQGIGFRPYVFRLATAYQLNGWVNNGVDGVHVAFNASEEDALLFYQNLIDQAPTLARITSHSIERMPEKFFDQFQIIESNPIGNRNLLLSPDFATCNSCREDLFQQGNRRQGYAFTTCTHCGPRFSIVQGLPYDKSSTSMAVFEMCADCQLEYNQPLDRRYFSQTNSCEKCGIQLTLHDSSKEVLSQEPGHIFKTVANAWRSGKIVAIKGIGGYLLTCSASDADAIRRLREKKHRPAKPLALMYPDEVRLQVDFSVRKPILDALMSEVAPIVLLECSSHQPDLALSDIAPSLDQIGVMLPYTPLYHLLLQEYGHPIVASSGNISQSPIVFRDEQALEELGNLADYLLLNNRDIAIPQDDSVLKWSPQHQQKIILRRSRGLSPTYINPRLNLSQACILALGAELKSTFAVQHAQHIYISQYLGDLDQYDTQQNFKHCIGHFEKLLEIQPKILLSDKYPTYSSSLYARERASQLKCRHLSIQHHEAHFAAILGEHALVDSNEAILGVIWDGTGWGDDGQIWGGEFFLYENHRFTRKAHLGYFPAILGDKLPKEPRIAALAATYEMPIAVEWLKPKFTPAEWKLYLAMLAQNATLGTSSMGRLFDAVASLLGILDKQRYEGEAAMLLEACASRHLRENPDEKLVGYTETGLLIEKSISFQPILAAVLADVMRKEPRGKIALKFHVTLVYIIQAVAHHWSIKKIAFSGGVFQNALLLDLIRQHLESEFELYFHDQLSPNDENISFGQLMWYHISCCGSAAS